MADPLSLCASILGVAGAGIRLSTGLYTFSQTVLRADSSIKDVAQDIALTSSVLEELRTLLAVGDRARLCSNRAARTASEAINGCKGVFDEIDGLLKGSTKNKSQFVLSGFGKLKWPLTEKKMQYLRSNLDRLKSTLILLLSVLNYARDLDANKAASVTPELQIQRRQIEALVKLNQMHQGRFLELRSIDESETSTLVGSSSSIRSFDTRDPLDERDPSRSTAGEDEDYQYQRKRLKTNDRNRATEETLSPNPVIYPFPPPPPLVPKESSDESYASVLRKCEEAVRGLVDHLRKADELISTADEPGSNLYAESERYLCETLSVHIGRLPVPSTAGHFQPLQGVSFRAGTIENDGSGMSADFSPINMFIPPGRSKSEHEKLLPYHQSELMRLEQKNRQRIMLQRQAQDPPFNPPPQNALSKETLAEYHMQIAILEQQKKRSMLERQAHETPVNPPQQNMAHEGVLADYQIQLMLLEQQNTKRALLERRAQETPINPPDFDKANKEAALADYQMQLMLLEQQNKKRLTMARGEDVHMQHQAQDAPINPTRQDAAINGVALADYQMQLMLLEQQNKKRLTMARKAEDVHMERPAQDAHVNPPRQNTASQGALADYQMQLKRLEPLNKKRLMVARQEQEIGNSASNGGPGGIPEALQAENLIKSEDAESASKAGPVVSQVKEGATIHGAVTEPHGDFPPLWWIPSEESTSGPIGRSYKMMGTSPLAMQGASSFFGSHPTAMTPLKTSTAQSMPTPFDASQPPMIKQEHLEPLPTRASATQVESRPAPPLLGESLSAPSSPESPPIIFTPDGSEPDQFMAMAPATMSVQFDGSRSGFASGGDNVRSARDALDLKDGITVEQLMAEWTTLVL